MYYSTTAPGIKEDFVNIWRPGREAARKDKLVFGGVHPRFAVIANQCAHWCGNPPDREETYRKAPGKMGFAAIFGGNRYLVPLNGGIATPVCALVRNDR